MKRTEESKKPVVHYCLCGAEHLGDYLKPGWYAIYKTNKRVKIERVVCPECLVRLGVKVKQN